MAWKNIKKQVVIAMTKHNLIGDLENE